MWLHCNRADSCLQSLTRLQWNRVYVVHHLPWPTEANSLSSHWLMKWSSHLPLKRPGWLITAMERKQNEWVSPLHGVQHHINVLHYKWEASWIYEQERMLKVSPHTMYVLHRYNTNIYSVSFNIFLYQHSGQENGGLINRGLRCKLQI